MRGPGGAGGSCGIDLAIALSPVKNFLKSRSPPTISPTAMAAAMVQPRRRAPRSSVNTPRLAVLPMREAEIQGRRHDRIRDPMAVAAAAGMEPLPQSLLR